MRAAREEVAAALLGRVVRGSLGRRRYGAFRERRTEEAAAMAAFEAQMKAVAAENARARAERELQAAMVLEACGRGYADRKLVGRLKVRNLERKADAAAYDVLIEAVRAEVEAMAVARQTRAALMLQMLGRRWAARKNLEARKEARLEIEVLAKQYEVLIGQVRAWAKTESVRRTFAAASRLQSHIRGWRWRAANRSREAREAYAASHQASPAISPRSTADSTQSAPLARWDGMAPPVALTLHVAGELSALQGRPGAVEQLCIAAAAQMGMRASRVELIGARQLAYHTPSRNRGIRDCR